MLKVLCAVVISSLLVGCASLEEAKGGFVCERVYRNQEAPLRASDTEVDRDLTVPSSRLKCSGKKLAWFRLKFN
jgi:type IV pilus biogenesis protein CpaD/CtpE